MSLQLFVPVLALSGVLAAAEMPLRVGDLVTGPPTHVRVTNTSTLAVTAWALAATIAERQRRHSSAGLFGRRLSERGHARSAELERAHRAAHARRIARVALDPLPAGPTVDVIAAVLDDGTAVGDEDALRAIFENAPTNAMP